LSVWDDVDDAETTMRVALLVAAIACGAAVLRPLPADAAPKAGTRVSVIACPYPGPTANCLMIKGSGGQVYNVTAVRPRPRLSTRMIWLRGTVTDKASICGQGIVLERIRWTRTRQRCSR
jgi:hypothetical protein